MSKYFNESEMACKCCDCLPPNGISEVLLNKLDALRELVGEPIHVTCMYRCPKHNAEVGGVSNSQHVLGTAADVYCDGLTVAELTEAAKEVGFDGIGSYYDQEFVHVDCRDDGDSPCGYLWSDKD